eukprot:1495129-Amphidinium_carterae.1
MGHYVSPCLSTRCCMQHSGHKITNTADAHTHIEQSTLLPNVSRWRTDTFLYMRTCFQEADKAGHAFQQPFHMPQLGPEANCTAWR